jgi:hypothetical protein
MTGTPAGCADPSPLAWKRGTKARRFFLGVETDIPSHPGATPDTGFQAQAPDPSHENSAVYGFGRGFV